MNFYFKNFIGVYLIYYIVLVSGIQQCYIKSTIKQKNIFVIKFNRAKNFKLKNFKV